MSLRFRRSIRVLPGVRLNLGLHGAGLSVGPRGLHVGVNRRGMYTSAGIPGTGLYAFHHIHTGAGEHQLRSSGSGCGAALIVVLVAAVILLGMWVLVLSQSALGANFRRLRRKLGVTRVVR